MSEHIQRRRLIQGTAALGALLAVSPKLALAEHEKPKTIPLKTRLDQILLSREPKEEKVTITMAKVAEDGSLVPCQFAVESPMSADDHITNAWLIVDKNPDPLIMHVKPKQALGAVEIDTQIRMAEPSYVRVYAETNKGELLLAKKWVEATGGCG